MNFNRLRKVDTSVIFMTITLIVLFLVIVGATVLLIVRLR